MEKQSALNTEDIHEFNKSLSGPYQGPGAVLGLYVHMYICISAMYMYTLGTDIQMNKTQPCPWFIPSPHIHSLCKRQNFP